MRARANSTGWQSSILAMVAILAIVAPLRVYSFQQATTPILQLQTKFKD
jgi:hypothetical protein